MTRTILIIDDEPNMRWVLGRALEQAGYVVHGATSGDEAANLLLREPIDLVLLDLKLKGEDGLTVLRRLRERRPELVVIILTAYGTVPTAVEAMQLGAADFLRKPFDVEAVIFKVTRSLERRSMQQELERLHTARRSAPAFILEHLADWQSIAELSKPDRYSLVEQAVQEADRPRELRRLRALVRQNYGLLLYTEVEQAKRRLSSDTLTALELDLDELSFRHELARREFERLIGPESRTIAMCVDQTLRDAGARPEDIDVAVRTGGSSRIPRFVRLLAERFGAERLHAMDAFTSVGAGLGIAAWERAQAIWDDRRRIMPI
jgi:DNA-binding response OmpR family regulator